MQAIRQLAEYFDKAAQAQFARTSTESSSEQKNNTHTESNSRSVEGRIKYLVASENETSSIKQQINDSKNALNDLKPVTSVSSKEIIGKNKRQIIDYLNKIFNSKFNGVIDRQNFGKIEFTAKEINRSLDYLNTDAEKVALLTVPYVIKRGIIIGDHTNHKGRLYDTVTIAAPVVIDGKRGNVGVIIRCTGQNRYKTHRILMPDGSEFVLPKNNAEVTSPGVTNDKINSQRSGITSASNQNISQDSTNVNNNSKKNNSSGKKSYDDSAKDLETELNNAGLYLQSKDNNKNNLRVKKYITEHHPELNSRVEFTVSKQSGTVSVTKIKTQQDIDNEAKRQKESEENYRRKMEEEKFYQRVKTYNGVNLLIDSLKNHFAKDKVDAEIRFSKSMVGTISFYVDYTDTSGDLQTIKVSDHFTENQRLEHPDEEFINLKHCVSFGDVYARIKEIINGNSDIRYAIYDAITESDIAVLRSIGRKSINDFSSADIKKSEKWARKFYRELGTKSPFFRAWFGDWRAFDNSKLVKVSKVSLLNTESTIETSKRINQLRKDKKLPLGDFINNDTGFSVNIGAQVYNDTLTYANREYSRYKNYQDYILRSSLLLKMDDIVKNSVLLDTEIIEESKNKYRTFMHTLYNIAENNGKLYIIKLKVDEILSNNGINRRAYNLDKIEISPVAVSQVYKPADTTSDNNSIFATANSVADLFSLVKQYDKKFNPASAKIFTEIYFRNLLFFGVSVFT